MTIKLAELNAWVAQIGELVNLIEVNTDGETGSLNADWFLNPWGDDDTGRNINGIPYRPQILLPLLDQMLSPATDIPTSALGQSPAGTALKWYPIQNEGAATGASVVLSDPSADYSETPGYVGAGLQWGKDLGSGYSVNVALYVPLYQMDETDGGETVFCSASAPAQMLVSLTNAAGFNDGTNSFATVQVQGLLALGTDGSPNLSAAFLDDAGNSVETFDSCSAFYTSAIMTTLNGALAAPVVNDWLTQPLSASTSITPGDLFAATGLLTQDAAGDPYTVNDLSDTLDQPPLDVAEDMVFNALDLLAEGSSEGDPLFTLSGAEFYILSVLRENGDTDYGLRLVLADLGLGKVPEGESNAPANGANAGKPRLTVQLGKWLTGETGYEDSWLQRSMPEGAGTPDPTPQPGISLIVMRRDAQEDVSFFLGLALVSVGLDYLGSVSDPVVQLNGVTLRGFEVRGELSVQYDPASDDPLQWSMGGAVRLDNIGLPLGTSFDRNATEGDNPEAANLVASGDGEGGNTPEGETDAVNPSFSVSASYLVDGQLGVQLYDENDAPTDVVWFPIQGTYGPLFCRMLGVGWQQEQDLLSLIADAGVSVAGLSVELINLSVSIPVTTPLDLSSYDLGLDGINVDFKEGPIEVSAGLLYNTSVDPADYEGQGLIRAWRLSISAMGAYSTVDDTSSLFLFAMLDFPLGGIPAFFINGLSGGFGYNRDLILPTIDQVPNFPLVAGIDNPELLGSTPTSALTALGDYVPPSRGDYWLAAGMKWTTYDLVNTNALVTVEFGNDFELGVIGLSVVSLPQDTDKKFAYAELGLELVLDIGGDEFIAAASLSPNSFIIDKNFRLSGGFALDAWWGESGNGGDFVVTLGGYSAAYQPPDYYPTVDRLGFSFAFSKNLTMGGDLYFALTTSNIMAGGQIDVSASALGASLWFTGDADLIMFWQPFYFDAHMAVSAGASYTISMFGVSTTLKLEAGGTFNLWSPETGGNIEIDFWFFNVPFSFGAEQSPDSTLPVDWDAFATMLPPAAGSMAPVYSDPNGDGEGEGEGDGDGDGEDTSESADGDDTSASGDTGSEDTGSGDDGDQDDAPSDDEDDDLDPEDAVNLKAARPRVGLSLAATPSTAAAATTGTTDDGDPPDPGTDPDPATDLSLVQINVISGLVSYVPGDQGDDGPQAWLVRPILFGMSTATVIPATDVAMMGPDGTPVVMATAPEDSETGILPMAATIDEAEHLITITDLDSGVVQDPANWSLTPATMGMPASMWSVANGGTPPDDPELIPDCLVGASDLRHIPHDALTGPPAFDILSAFQYHVLDDSDTQDWLPIVPSATPASSGAPQVCATALRDVAQINDTAQIQARDDIFAALAEMGADAGTNGALSAMAAQPSGALRGNPLLSANAVCPEDA